MKALNKYLISRFAIWLFIVLAGFGAVAILGDFLEMLRFSNRFDLGTGAALGFTLQRLPLILLDFLPFIFLFGTVFCLLRLSQDQELAVIRAAGLSVWQFLTPLLVFTFLIASLIVAILEPIGARSMASFAAKQAEITGIRAKLSFSTGGIWFREQNDQSNYIIRAEKLDPENAAHLQNIEVTLLDETGRFSRHLEARSAQLGSGIFVLQDVKIFTGADLPQTQEQFILPTQLTLASIENSFKPPQTIGLWKLPGYIAQARATGMDVSRHEARFQSLLALPILLLSMVMVAACFSLPTGRTFSTSQTLGFSVLCGFLVFLFNDFIGLMGELNILPSIMASWTPALIALLLSVSYLLTTEDG